MKTYKIAVIGGDGIGPEVTKEAIKVLDAVATADKGFKLQYQHLPWGTAYYHETGSYMPKDGLEQIRGVDAIYFGAVGDQNVPDHISLDQLILRLRRGFDQGVCVRPALLMEGATSPLAGKKPGDIDIVTFRENTEGEYANAGGFVYQGFPNEVAVQTNIFTRKGTERIIRAAFEYARKARSRKKVTSVTKSNAQGFSMVFWDRVFKEVAAEYPDVKTESLLVDRACMDLVRWPEAFDVIVASNLFADIITDITAVITGSLGLAPSANINPTHEFPSMFEPVHGAAFDIMGKGIANPLAAVLASAMLLEHIGEQTAADKVNAAVRSSLKDGKVLTADMGGKARTADVGDDVAKRVARR